MLHDMLLQQTYNARAIQSLNKLYIRSIMLYQWQIYILRETIYICSKLWSTVSYIFKENIFQTKGFKESLRKSKPIVERCVWMNLWINAFDILMWLFYLKTCSHRISIYNHACYRSHYTLMTLHSLSIIVAKLCNCVWI